VHDGRIALARKRPNGNSVAGHLHRKRRDAAPGRHVPRENGERSDVHLDPSGPQVRGQPSFLPEHHDRAEARAVETSDEGLKLAVGAVPARRRMEKQNRADQAR